MAELTEIMAAIVELQETIETPYDEPALADAVNGPPAAGHGFPCFFNEESAETPSEIERMGGLRITRHTIEMHLLLAAAEAEYSLESRRRWVKAVLDKFDNNMSLNGTVTQAVISRIEWGPVTLNEIPYIAATFVLGPAEIKEGFAFEG